MTIGYKWVCRLQPADALPLDQTFNTFYTDTVSAPATVTPAFTSFYTTIWPLLHPSLAGGASALKIDQYAIPDTRPPAGMGFGPPLSTTNCNLPAATVGAAGYPSEVSITLSFHADYTTIPEHIGSTRPRARYRGRVYLGPMGENSGFTQTTGGRWTVVAASALTTITGAASTLLHVSSLGWSVFSRKNWALYPVIGGWVDNAFDVQRRRGTAASAKSLWS